MSTNIVRLAKEFVVVLNNMVVARCTDFSLSLDSNIIDITSLDSDGFEEKLGGSRNWSINFGSMVTRDYGDQTGCMGTGYGTGVFNALFDHWASDEGSYPITVGLGDPSTAANATGNFFTGCGILNSLNADGAVGEKITYSGTITGSGKLSRSTYS